MDEMNIAKDSYKNLKITDEDFLYFLKISSEIINTPIYLSTKNYIQHGNTTVYDHQISVALKCFAYSVTHKRKKIRTRELVRAALLHDFYLYDWHILEGRKRLHGFRHPKIAALKAQEIFNINNFEKKIIVSHMWPLTFFHFPTSKEGWILSLIDKRCSIKEIFKRKKDIKTC